MDPVVEVQAEPMAADTASASAPNTVAPDAASTVVNTGEALTVVPASLETHDHASEGVMGFGMLGLATLAAVLLLFLWKVLAKPKGGPPEPARLGTIRTALARTRAALGESLDRLMGKGADHPDFFDELEMLLLAADIGIGTVEGLLDELREEHQEKREGFDPKALIKEVLFDLVSSAPGLPIGSGEGKGPRVILVVGVNGSGKTTTIGKLAAGFTAQGKKVVLAAADTYRAAASEQLAIWAERAKAEIVQAPSGADPAAVAFDGVSAGVARCADVVLIDTAGRLQTAKPLMEQLSKIRRVIEKVLPDAPHETLLVLDGTMGQNGLSQARLFNEATPITGVIVTKLDGTAKGGMIFTLADELELPVKMIGVGEKLEDLRVFEPRAFVDALF